MWDFSYNSVKYILMYYLFIVGYLAASVTFVSHFIVRSN